MKKPIKTGILILFTSLAHIFNFHAAAQNANELKFMKYEKDSTLLFDTKSYLRELKKSGIPSSQAALIVKNLKAEIDALNQLKINKNLKSFSFNSSSNNNSTFSSPSSSSYCWRSLNQSGDPVWPGELVSSNPNCSCYVPTNIAPICPNTNIGFEEGTFNGWLGRTGKYLTIHSNCNVGLDFDATGITGPSGDEPARHLLVNKGGNDPIAGFPLVEDGSDNNYAVRLGNSMNGAKADQLVYKLKANSQHRYLNYKYAVVLQDPGDHLDCHRPSFSVELYKVSGCGSSSQRIECGSFIVKYKDDLPGFISFHNGVYKPWTNVVVDLLPYMSDPNSGEEFFIKFTTTDCAWGGHYGYAYIDGVCTDQGLLFTGNLCIGSPVQFYAPTTSGESATYSWKINNQAVPGESPILTHQFESVQSYNVSASITTVNPNCSTLFNTTIDIEQCHAMFMSCEDDCIASFAPEKGKKYVLSAWIKEKIATYTPTYLQAKIKLKFTSSNCSTGCISPFICNGSFCEYAFEPKGNIIDGWQRIEQAFTVPNNATEMYIELLNTGSDEVFFDDIRIFPFDGSMKSYVYDPVSQKLLAELDENNYATFYEYDNEGNLVRVKKETERGTKTIKESMSNTSVKPVNP